MRRKRLFTNEKMLICKDMIKKILESIENVTDICAVPPSCIHIIISPSIPDINKKMIDFVSENIKNYGHFVKWVTYTEACIYLYNT